MGKLIVIATVLLSLSLAGCASHGYVESDIPDVASWFAKPAIDSNVEQTCTNYKAAYGAVSQSTTSVGLTRTRVEFSFLCE